VVALVGLLGILVGEQLPPLVRSLWQKEPVIHSWIDQVKPHMFGHLPKGQRSDARIAADKTPQPPAGG
jgi:xanthosine utilization system XapX-like protein